MAQQQNQSDRLKFSCSICLDLLRDPVTIPCGHTYCMDCIKTHWDLEDTTEIYSCPQCRKTFTVRPPLVRNMMLGDLLLELELGGFRAAAAGAAAPEHCYAGPEDVVCDFCSGRKLKAIKSCLSCLASYCEKHLQPHYDVAPLKKHKLVEPSKNLQENICSLHDEVMKMFCRTDQKCICYLCSVDEHKGHDTVSAAAERTERQKEVDVRLRQIHQGMKNIRKDVRMLLQEEDVIDRSADKTVEDCEKIFTELTRLFQKRTLAMKQQIRFKQDAEINAAKELREKLENEMGELIRKTNTLNRLLKTQDHNLFLQNYLSLSALSESALSESTHSSRIDIYPRRYFEDVTAGVSELRDKLQDILTDGCTNASVADTVVDVLLSEPEPKSRADFLKYSCEITLDPRTAFYYLELSERNRKVTAKTESSYSGEYGLPSRFKGQRQVLSIESLTGRHYWEVEMKGDIYVAVAYNNISRTGKKSAFGHNDKSWALYCFQNGYRFFFNRINVSIPLPRSSRVGVDLDHKAGLLSFYSVSETMTLLHRVQTTFTQPLYAGVGMWSCQCSAELVKMT